VKCGHQQQTGAKTNVYFHFFFIIRVQRKGILKYKTA
jgi:hypothetical protein